MAKAQSDPYLGRLLLDGQLRLLEKIGVGGMGAVYKAHQAVTGRYVAVKILHAHLAQRPDLVARFRREARALGQLTHPNTVKVLHYGELPDGALYLVMELLEGENLNHLLQREGKLPVERAIPILLQVCGALEEAHQRGIVHRDLKPENIFICHPRGAYGDVAKVLDFGLAKVLEREALPGGLMLTQEGMVFGTPEFMSPEQAQGKPLDSRSDLYSLAVILYELLTGKLPFDAANPMDHVAHHVTKAPILLDERVPGLTFPRGLGLQVARALSKKPEERHASVADFATALRNFAPYAGATLAWTPIDEATPLSALPKGPLSGRGSSDAAVPAYPLWVWGAVAFACVAAGALVMVLAVRALAALTG